MSPNLFVSSSFDTAQVLEGAEAIFVTEQVKICRQLHPDGDMNAYLVGGGVAAITKASYTRKLNHVAGFGMNGPVTEKDLEIIERAYSTIKLPPEIDLCLYTNPTAFQVLAARGYVVKDVQNVYVRLLDDEDINAVSPNETEDAGIQVTRVSEEESQTFIEASVQGFRSGGRSTDLLQTLAQITILRSDTIAYLARIDGKIAGSGGLALLRTPKGIVTQLCVDSTVPEFRGRGVQAALIRARLSDARRFGAVMAYITARPHTSSVGNAERAGFRLAYNKPTFTRRAC